MFDEMVIPSHLVEHTIDQDYSKYTDEDHRVWQKVISQKENILSLYAGCIESTYISGFFKIGFVPYKIPKLEEINKTLKTVGWSAACVDGYITASVYANFISNRIFPISRHIRRMEHIDHSPIPDFIHDVTGHLPMLFSENYHEFLRRIVTVMNQVQGNALDKALFAANTELGYLKELTNPDEEKISKTEQKILEIQAALKNEPSPLTHLNRMFLWSIEFGLLGSVENYKCFGAGIMTSPLEIQAVCQRAKKVLPYSVSVIDYDVNFTDAQEQFFAVKSFQFFEEVLDEYLNSKGS